MKPPENEQKGKTEVGARRCEECHSEDDRRGMGAFAAAGKRVGAHKVRVTRAVCTRGDSGRRFSRRQAGVGGIIRQLMAITDDQLAHHQSQIARLEDVQQKLSKLLDDSVVVVERRGCGVGGE